VVTEEPFLRAHIVPAKEKKPKADNIEFSTIISDLRARVAELIDKSDVLPFELQLSLHSIEDAEFFINMVSYHIPLKLSEKMELLSLGDLKLRAYKLLEFVNREIQYANLKLDIQNRTQHTIDNEQKEYFLRHQLKTINMELGEENSSPEVAKLLEKAKTKKWGKEVEEAFNKEMERLKQMHPQSSDYNVQLSYLQQIVDLPWGEFTDDDMDLARAQKILDRDHYGMEKVKERILEYIAVLKLRGDLKSPILCLYGPPGVGKTSLGKSIADALRRKYVRVSLGGLHDEAEIRGHRRTYVGAMPGRIIKNIEKSGSSNPVFILDEIDKVTQNTNHGDPASALLEVLDPEQNSAFHDNFLDLDYDLSKVMFIATANDLSTIPAPLRDRMEIIEVSGYTTEEKIEIAKRHLVPREKDKTGLKAYKSLTFRKPTLEKIIERYTRESGVRQLEKQINKCLRKLAFYLTRDGALPYDKITPENLEDLLGKPQFYSDIYHGDD
jgi:ATP-dependent Lon protease